MKSTRAHLIFHKDHPLHVRGVNSGAENATLWLARTLAAQGDIVYVAGNIPEGDCIDHQVRFWDIGSTYNVELAFQRMRVLGMPYHVTSACRALPLVFAQREPDCLSRTFIAHDPSGTATGVQASVLSSLCDTIICVSEAQKKLFTDAGINAKKVTVIPNGADLTLFEAGDVETRCYNRFVFVGALVAHKGIDILLQAFANLAGKYPEAELHVYGSAGLWGQESFFDEKQISAQCPQIKFFGAVPQQEVARAFQHAGACIIPSRWFDSFPLTAVEALVTGCPVVAFNVGGISEAVCHDETGVLLPVPDEASLTQTLEYLLSHPSKLKAYSQQALATARHKFSWAAFVNAFDSCIDAAIKRRQLQPGRVGFVTTWNQPCGLATYARFLTKELPLNSFAIFAEITDTSTDNDEPHVTRCWHRDSDNYEKLRDAVLAQDVKVLHLNAHASFFHYPRFTRFLEELRSHGVKVIASMHNIYTTEPALRELFTSLDTILVHCKENIPEALANGARPEQIQVIRHGVEVRPEVSEDIKAAVRVSFQIPSQDFIVACFGFIQPHKGIESLLDAVASLRSIGMPVTGLICGIPHSSDAHAKEYYQRIKQAVHELGISQYIRYTDRFVSENEVSDILGTADIVLMNYRSQHYEASGACAVAVGCGAAVVTSLAPPFQVFEDAVFHATSGYPVTKAIQMILSEPVLAASLKQQARIYAQKFSWKNTGAAIQRQYRALGVLVSSIPLVQKESIMSGSEQTKRMKVLLCNRPSTFTQRGGDTVVIEKLMAGLANYPVDITINLDGVISPKDFDLVHIFNFALPDMVEYYARQAQQAGVPYVITTLLEDVPNFHYQSHFVASIVQEYQRIGYDRAWWHENKPNYRAIEKAPAFNNTYAAQHAAALYPNGATEARTLRREYNVSSNIAEIKLGYELGVQGNAERFFQKYGVKDFILCVGRFETRKNQLMLLKALEDEDVTVVLAGGGFTYQPPYATAVEQFKRKGKTIILPKLTDQDLADAYAAAKVHVLPSWYELPGLVSLEAAFYGCNVVATRCGTAADYLGEHAYYCDPGDDDSIRSAVLAALYAPVNPNLKEKVMTYSWKEMADKTFDSYRTVSGWKQPAAMQTPEADAIPQPQAPEMVAADRVHVVESTDPIKFQEQLEKGEILAREHRFEEALQAFAVAQQFAPADGRLHRAKGATLLAANKTEDAMHSFQQALVEDASDAKSFCGLGMCQAILGQSEAAYESFVRSLTLKPDHPVALLQLMHIAYSLNRYEDLERFLRQHVEQHPEDHEMQFCLAGCLYKLDQTHEAIVLNNAILARNPDHAGARELAALLKAYVAPLAGKVEVERAPQARSDLSSIDGSFDSIDQEILMIEECKRKGKYEEAFSRIAALATNSNLTAAQRETITCQKAESLMLTDKYNQAEHIYNEVLEGNPDSARALCGHGALAATRGQWDRALELFQEALSKRPEYDVALAGLGLCATQHKKPEEAWNLYRRALKSNPENVRALLGIIEMGYSLQRLTEVEEVLKQYLDCHPADLDFMYSLAGCYFAQGKVAQAAEAINTITLFEPRHQHALELRAMIEKQGESITA